MKKKTCFFHISNIFRYICATIILLFIANFSVLGQLSEPQVWQLKNKVISLSMVVKVYEHEEVVDISRKIANARRDGNGQTSELERNLQNEKQNQRTKHIFTHISNANSPVTKIQVNRDKFWKLEIFFETGHDSDIERDFFFELRRGTSVFTGIRTYSVSRSGLQKIIREVEIYPYYDAYSNSVSELQCGETYVLYIFTQRGNVKESTIYRLEITPTN